jgi:hypothetical protein
MKAITKAKRRLTLSLSGLGLLDELEAETIKDAKIVSVDIVPPATISTPYSMRAEPLSDMAPPVVPVSVTSAPIATDDELDAHLGMDMSVVSKTLDEYTINFGKHTGRGVRDLGLHECREYVEWLKKTAADSGSVIKPNSPVTALIDMVTLYEQEIQHDADLEYWRNNGSADRQNQDQPNH